MSPFFACCTSQKHNDMRESHNVQKHATKSDTMGNCLQCAVCRHGSGSLHVLTEISQHLEKYVCTKIQSIQIEYTWLNILHPLAVVAEIMKI